MSQGVFQRWMMVKSIPTLCLKCSYIRMTVISQPLGVRAEYPLIIQIDLGCYDIHIWFIII